MRVLCWTPFFLPDIGGIEVLLAKMLPGLKQRGYEFVVVTSHGGHKVDDVTTYDGIPVHRFHTRAAIENRHLKQLIQIRRSITKLKQTFQPDLVHVHFSDPSVYFHLNTAAAYPAPTLLSIHQNFAYFGLKAGLDTLVGQLLDMADWVTAVSEITLSGIVAYKPQIKARSSVIYNGLDVPEIDPAPLPFEVPQILCLGRLLDQKGFDLAIIAFAALLDRFPQARLIIAGDGPKRNALEGQAAALGLAEKVDFRGQVSPENVLDLINEATMVVMPSRSEGFPMVALEAALMARPIIATPVGGLPESVVHQETGLFIDPDDSQALAEMMAFLLDHPDQARQMGLQGRSRVLNTFNLEQTFEAYDTLYRKLIQETSQVRIGQ